MKNLISWGKNHKLETVFIVCLLVLALGMRVWRLPEYMVFLGDEGRDALVVKKILVEKDFPLLGPVTSIGNMDSRKGGYLR